MILPFLVSTRSVVCESTRFSVTMSATAEPFNGWGLPS